VPMSVRFRVGNRWARFRHVAPPRPVLPNKCKLRACYIGYTPYSTSTPFPSVSLVHHCLLFLPYLSFLTPVFSASAEVKTFVLWMRRLHSDGY
jgi:hypothetical protein